VARKLGTFKASEPRLERCRNPWNGRCENTDIQLYIYYDGERLPICGKCWSQICDGDFEWGEHKRSKSVGEEA
jgi:hypothetical protein